MDDFDQFKATYITECFELLQEMEERLLSLDSDSADLDEVNAIFRCAHSIKGGAGAFGFDDITHFTHILETLLDAMRDNQVPITREAVDALLKSVDIVTQMVQAAQAGSRMPEGFGRELAEELVSFVDDPDLSAAKAETGSAEDSPTEQAVWRISFKPHKELLVHGNEPLLILRELKTLGELEVEANLEALPSLEEIVPEDCYLSWTLTLTTDKPESAIREAFEFVEDECDLAIEKTEMPAEEVSAAEGSKTPPGETEDAKAAPAGEAPKAPTATSVRVDVDKIDRLVNMVGELVITQAMLQAQTKFLPIDQYPELLRGVEELTQHSRELQEAVMAVRMQPVKSIFSRMPRIVRDLSSQLGKKINMEMIGEYTEIDKTVIEQLSDPLVHMIRNSVDHGVEMPEIRKERGKPEEGTIRLSADNRGGRIVIEIEDDGGGVNREKVLAKAQEKGLAPKDAKLSDEEIDNLIFEPGFSTAEEVSNISGRGVGMDVVKRNINALGGDVFLQTTPGQGSRFVVSLPLTLAILDGMIVRAGREYYIIPISNIIETMRPAEDEVRKIADGNDVINVRGEFIPVIYLFKKFEIEDAISEPSQALVVLVEHGRSRFGLVVDELVGQQQVVIKSLEANSDPVEGISGATILGDGKVSLILDIGGLVPSNGQGAHSNLMHAA